MSLRPFLTARDRAEANGRRLVLTGAGPPVRRVFEITGSESLLVDHDAVSELDS
jgi:anti-anti-sigma regulatory factor